MIGIIGWHKDTNSEPNRAFQRNGAMNQYDPELAPNPDEWLKLDEQERILLIEQHHRLARDKLPNLTAHATFHTIVENQIVLNLESVVRAMTRLTKEGLTRQTQSTPLPQLPPSIRPLQHE